MRGSEGLRSATAQLRECALSTRLRCVPEVADGLEKMRVVHRKQKRRVEQQIKPHEKWEFESIDLIPDCVGLVEQKWENGHAEDDP